MKVVHLLPSLNPAQGGPAAAVPSIANALHELGHQVTIATMDPPDTPVPVPDGVRVEQLGPGIGRYGYTPALTKWLAANAPAHDAVIVNGIWQYHSLAAWRVLSSGIAPYYVFPHGMLDPWFKRTFPLKHLKKCIYWWLAEYHVLANAAAVLFTTESERALAAQSFMPYRVRSVVIPYGTRAPRGDPDAERAEFLARFPRLAGKRCLLFLGRLAVKKGADLLVRAFAACAAEDPSLALVMAGPDFGERAGLEALARRLRIEDRVVWTGLLQGSLKWGALRCASAFALPSHQENFGVAVVEAMAVGVPVLITDQVGIHHEVTGTRAGFVGPDTLAGVEGVLRRWLALSGAERAAMGERGRTAFHERYEIHNAARALAALMSERR